MKKTLFGCILLFAIINFLHGQDQKAVLSSKFYGTGKWNPDSLGNHRAVIKVEKKSEIVLSHVEWRRRDLHPGQKGFVLIDATTGKPIQNVFPVNINREFGDILFEPVTVPGEYYLYYLKYKPDGKSNYPKIKYPAFSSSASPDWLKVAGLAGKNLNSIPRASFLQFQSVDDFNSFYPMDLIATQGELDKVLNKNEKSSYLVFPEERTHSIRMTKDLPAKWIADGPGKDFAATVKKGEYFTFQLGLFAARQNIEDVKIKFSSLGKSGKFSIDEATFTCFNLGGTDWEGKPFVKKCFVPKGNVQPLWIGFQVPDHPESGLYTGVVTIIPKNMPATKINLKITISEEKIIDSGDNEPEKMTRLRWLNSTLANDDEIVAPYTPLVVSKNSIECLGRKVTLNNLGLPESIKSYFSESVTKILPEGKEILAAPVDFIVEKDKKVLTWNKPSVHFIKKTNGAVTWEIESETSGLTLRGKAQMEFDGNIDYKLILTAKEDLKVSDIRLEIPYKPEASRYMMGLGQKG